MLLSPSSSAAEVLNNFEATADPTPADDSTQGYSVGSRWVNLVSDVIWTLVDDTAIGAAVWFSRSRVVDGGTFFDTFYDLGTVDGGTF